MLRLSAVLVALLLLPTLALAKEGMPQLDFANPLTNAQVIWGAIIFAVMYLLLSRWALPQVGSMLEERATKIASDLEAARAAKATADAAAAELTDATQRARAEAQAAINRAADKAKADAAAQTEALNARLDAQLEAAERRIESARLSAVGAMSTVARETAETVITRLTGMHADPSVVDRAVGAALSARARV
jgi:F-type H+-transporting ATPase subunit b